jgi:hypothetical protein
VHLRESNGARDDLARALVVVENVEAVPAGRMIHQVQRRVAGQRFLHERVDRLVESEAARGRSAR